MAVPIKSFWMLNAGIDRINAQDDMRSLTVASVSQNGEASQEYREKLVLEVGNIVTVDAQPEVEVEEGQSNLAGFAELKALSAMI